VDPGIFEKGHAGDLGGQNLKKNVKLLFEF